MQTDTFLNNLSKKERENVRGNLLKFRADGDKDDYSSLARKLGVDQSILAEIEQSPNYIDSLIKQIVLKNSSRLGTIVENLFAAAENGSIKHIDSLIKLLGVSRETLRIEEVKQDDKEKDYSDDEMAQRIKELS